MGAMDRSVRKRILHLHLLQIFLPARRRQQARKLSPTIVHETCKLKASLIRQSQRRTYRPWLVVSQPSDALPRTAHIPRPLPPSTVPWLARKNLLLQTRRTTYNNTRSAAPVSAATACLCLIESLIDLSAGRPSSLCLQIAMAAESGHGFLMAL